MCPSVSLHVRIFRFHQNDKILEPFESPKFRFLMAHARCDKETGTRVIFDVTQVSKLLVALRVSIFFICLQSPSIVGRFMRMSLGNVCKRVNAHFRRYFVVASFCQDYART